MNKTTNDPSEILELLDKAYEHRSYNLEQSIVMTQTALNQSRALKDIPLIAKSLAKLALYNMICGNSETSLKMSHEAIACYKSLNDELGIADANYNIAGVYYKTNNYHLGMFHLIDCLTTYRKYNDKHNESRTQKSLGTVYELLGDGKSAINAYKEAIRTAIDAGSKNLESNAYNPLSGILLKNNQPEKALELIERSIALKTETGDTRGFAFAIYGRGKVYTYLKRYKEAKKDFKEAIKIHKDVGDLFGVAMVYNKMGLLSIAIGNRKKGKKFLKKVIRIGEENNLSLVKYKSSHSLYEIYKEDGKSNKALKYLENYLTEKDTVINSQILKVIANYERISRLRSLEKKANLEKQKAEIMAKQVQVEQTAQMKQEFLSAMSHEIRTPLNAVTSIISLLEDRSSEEEKKLLRSLRFSSKNLLRIINDILDFSKLDSNKMSLEMRPVKFKELIKNIRETYVGLAKEKGISLKVDISFEIAKAYMLDETKLFQILGNLMSNAIKFTEKGEVNMVLELVKTEGKNDFIRFIVEDTGVGIPEKEMARLFESFYMPTSITTRSDGGTGLGLAIVKKLIELHGSSIEIESRENEGSKFYFILELEKTKIEQKPDNELFEKLNGATAILAEDNEINAMVMRELLKKSGIIIKRAKNGAAAVELAQEEKVDFILMDIHMPILNGYDAAKAIRAEESPNKETPIFALTADVTAVNDKKHKKYFNGFLWKPMEMNRLLEALAKVLG